MPTDRSRNTPKLPPIFANGFLSPTDTPHAYIQDSCQYLREDGGEDKRAPEVVVVSGCVVTAAAVRKARQYVARTARELPEARIIVTGCAARQAGIAAEFTAVGASAVGDLAEVPRALNAETGSLASPPARRTRRFIKVQDGCNSFCSYCIVPYVRKLESVPAEHVLARIDEEMESGTPEIVVCGINIGLYREPTAGFGVEELLRRILDRIPKHSRLRLSSIEPEHVSAELLELFAHPRMCPHLHLPLQSGSDEVLEAMRRHYNAGEYRWIVERFRKLYAYGAVTADLMVGYPSETERDFHTTCEMVRHCAFERAHIFRFSARPGTLAATFAPLPGETSIRREKELFTLSSKVAARSLERFIGSDCSVVIEDDNRGYGEAYQRVRVDRAMIVGQLVPVRLVELQEGLFKALVLDGRQVLN